MASSKLVVLSACQTGINDFSTIPDEAFGFPSALIESGAPGNRQHSWSIYDVPSALLMLRFYENLFRKKQPANQALAQAQLWLRDVTLDVFHQYLTDLKIEASMPPKQSCQKINYLQNRMHIPTIWAAYTFTGYYEAETTL